MLEISDLVGAHEFHDAAPKPRRCIEAFGPVV
jgi:hypothetical protein